MWEIHARLAVVVPPCACARTGSPIPGTVLATPLVEVLGQVLFGPAPSREALQPCSIEPVVFAVPHWPWAAGWAVHSSSSRSGGIGGMAPFQFGPGRVCRTARVVSRPASTRRGRR